MLRRSLVLSMLFAAGTCGAQDVPAAAEAMANVAPEARPAGEPTQAVGARSAPAQATPTAKEAEGGDKTLSGMSILGNQEAPKALVIVPWKSSRIGDSLGLADGLDDSRAPVDKEVFMRELGYYEIRSNAK